MASDFAAMIRAALALYEATGIQNYLDKALAWQRALDRDYANREGGTYYLTAADAEGLVIRPASTADEATPNHNAVAAQNLIRLALLSGDDAWREQADRLIAGVAPHAAENLYMHMALFNAVDLRLRAAEIVVTGGAPAPTLYLPLREKFRRLIALSCTRVRLTHCHPRIRPARRSKRRGAKRKLSSALAKPVRCRLRIKPACSARSRPCDIIDAVSSSKPQSCFMKLGAVRRRINAR
jgi:hypothetical protein